MQTKCHRLFISLCVIYYNEPELAFWNRLNVLLTFHSLMRGSDICFSFDFTWKLVTLSMQLLRILRSCTRKCVNMLINRAFYEPTITDYRFLCSPLIYDQVVHVLLRSIINFQALIGFTIIIAQMFTVAKYGSIDSI